MAEQEYAIVAEGLTRRFGSRSSDTCEKTAVNNISFKVRTGEIFGILGPNGAGKTTTIKMLSTLLIPSSGKAEILGMDVSSDKNVRSIRKMINVVSGGERGLYYRLSGRQNLEFFADLYRIPKKSQKGLIQTLLDLVDLTESADIKVENYSRGMKQRIHIARSLINNPRILYLDEPTIGLDPEISRGIRMLIRRLSDNGTTVILTTHYMFEAEELCDNMIILSEGRVVGRGNVSTIKASVSDTYSIKVVTETEPIGITGAEAFGGSEPETEMLPDGRFMTRFVACGGKECVAPYEELFRPFVIRLMGVEEPTLEDAYLALIKEGIS